MSFAVHLRKRLAAPTHKSAPLRPSSLNFLAMPGDATQRMRASTAEELHGWDFFRQRKAQGLSSNPASKVIRSLAVPGGATDAPDVGWLPNPYTKID